MDRILHSLIIMCCEMAPYILLGLFVAGLLHAFVPAVAMSRHLAKPRLSAVVKATLFGVPLPLCSCGVLPTAVALKRSGASKASTTAFLISTPQTGVDSIAATWSLLGPAFAVIRPIAAIVTAMFGGVAVGKNEAKEIENQHGHEHNGEHKHHHHTHEAEVCCEGVSVVDEMQPHLTFAEKLIATFRYAFFDMVQSIGGWLTFGLVIAALITVLVPADFFASFSEYPLLAMLAVVIVAVPMYVCATGSIPIALSLMLKGLTPGTAFVLLMAGPAANFASITILSRVMGRKSAAIYLATIVVGAMAFGLAIDYLMPRSWFPLAADSVVSDCHASPSLFQLICAAVLVALLAISFGSRLYDKYINRYKKFSSMTKEYQIKGMNCPHCQKTVQQAIASVAGVDTVVVDLSSGLATVEGSQDDLAVRKAVEAAGFDVE